MDLAQLYNYRLDWVASFVAVAEHGGFSAAAEVLYRSQPRISVHVGELERALGARLFDRTTHPITLTPEGRSVLPHAREVIRHMTALSDGASDADGSPRGEVRLGVYPSAAAFLLPGLLVQLRQSYPHIRLILREGPTISLDGPLLAGSTDLAVRPMLPRVECDRLAPAVLWSEPLVAVFAVEHPLAQAGHVRLEDLVQLSVITIGEEEDATSSQFETTLSFERAGLAPTVAFRTNQPQTLVAMVRAGLGTGITNGLAMTTSKLDGVSLVPIAEPHCRREVGLWWRADRPPSPALAVVRRLIQATPAPEWFWNGPSGGATTVPTNGGTPGKTDLSPIA